MKNRIVLVGAGNANLQVLRRWAMEPLPGTELMLVTDALEVPYSGMVPGFVNGTYRREEVLIDVVRLCGLAGALLVEGVAARLDLDQRQVVLEDGRRYGFDRVALNVGSVPDIPPGPDPRRSFAAKPLTHLLGEIDLLDRELEKEPTFHLAVVGSGAGGAELALALKRRHQDRLGFRITLIDANRRPLPGYPPRVSRLFEARFLRAEVLLQLGRRVIGKNASGLVLEGGEQYSCDGVLWVTRGAPTPFVQGLALPKDERGFVKVHRDLRSVGDSDVFATGDAIQLAGFPKLPKAGVFAVRQGPVLWHNLRASLKGEKLTSYRPQPVFLTLLNTSDGGAVGSYGRLSFRGTGAWKLKDAIDRRWMRKFQDLSGLEMDDMPMRCGGCGAKIPALELTRALQSRSPVSAPHVEVGIAQAEDAAVISIGGVRIVESVDFFRAFPLDAVTVGRVAALNALSDLWAMGAEPRAAQALVVLPEQAAHARLLGEILAGIDRALEGSGAVLAGGHTTEGAELAVGLAVTGEARRDFRKAGLKAGDRLILTKALGTGALLAGYGRGSSKAKWWPGLRESLLHSNQKAAECLAGFDVTAVTDVTGFGLGGHLLEMLRASGVSAEVDVGALPVLSGFYELLERGVQSTLHGENRKWVEPFLGGHPPAEILFDPQTSGGLIAGVPEESSEDVVHALRAAGYAHARIIGRIKQDDRPRIDLI